MLVLNRLNHESKPVGRLGILWLVLLCQVNLQAQTQTTGKRAKDWSGFGHNRQWQTFSDVRSRPFLSRQWSVEAGEGKAQIVGNQRALIVASGQSKTTEAESQQIETRIAARSANDGSELWNYEHVATVHSGQQTFSGAAPTPQATPLILGNRVIVLTFTGHLICLDANDGERLWSKDLVEEFAAEPVQFGFASSPVRCPGEKHEFVLFAGGERGGLIRFNDEGEVVWVFSDPTFSYATPTWMTLDGVEQWVVYTQDEVVGVDESGSRLWRFPLKETGLTNVPSPLAADETHVLVSGQGCAGTICIEVASEQGQWMAREQWHNKKLNFFTTNWMKLDDSTVLACNSAYLAAFDFRTGELQGRWRGYQEGNLLRTSEGFLALNGEGQLSALEYNASQQQLAVVRSYKLTDAGRCWVAPTMIGDRIYVRQGGTLQCLGLSQAATKDDLQNLSADKPDVLVLKKESAGARDPVLRIFEVFESDGQQAALALYAELRSNKSLSVSQRIALAEAAYKEGLKPLASMIAGHAQEDFPESQALKEKLAEWQGN